MWISIYLIGKISRNANRFVNCGLWSHENHMVFKCVPPNTFDYNESDKMKIIGRINHLTLTQFNSIENYFYCIFVCLKKSDLMVKEVGPRYVCVFFFIQCVTWSL